MRDTRTHLKSKKNWHHYFTTTEGNFIPFFMRQGTSFRTKWKRQELNLYVWRIDNISLFRSQQRGGSSTMPPCSLFVLHFKQWSKKINIYLDFKVFHNVSILMMMYTSLPFFQPLWIPLHTDYQKHVLCHSCFVCSEEPSCTFMKLNHPWHVNPRQDWEALHQYREKTQIMLLAKRSWFWRASILSFKVPLVVALGRVFSALKWPTWWLG